MQLRHISPGSSDWVDAMDEGGRGWEKLGPEERMKLRMNEYSSVWGKQEEAQGNDDRVDQAEDDYGWGEPSASR
jgi:hypothetical protein